MRERLKSSLMLSTTALCLIVGYPAFKVVSHLRPGNGLPRFSDRSVVTWVPARLRHTVSHQKPRSQSLDMSRLIQTVGGLR